jgi:hypothetical protein
MLARLPGPARNIQFCPEFFIGWQGRGKRPRSKGLRLCPTSSVSWMPLASRSRNGAPTALAPLMLCRLLNSYSGPRRPRDWKSARVTAS